MRRSSFLKSRRAISPVIATIILSAVVITIGGAVWSYAQGAATEIANDYVNGTLELLNEVTERFTVEHVSNNTDGTVLYVWVYNYGDVDVVVDIYANSNSSLKSTLGTPISSGSLVMIEVNFTGSPLQSGDEVEIKVYSRRQNSAYYTYHAS